MRVLAALSAAVALYALWSVERVDLDCDLQLAAPPEVRPGEAFAVRALVFCDLDALEGPRLVTPPVEVTELDREGRELMAPVALSATPLATLDGVLLASEGADADRLLVAKAIHEGLTLTVKRALRVRKNGAPERVVPREAGPLQQYSLGRVRATGSEPAPDRMLPRVVGGACVPEVPCTIVVWVGAPAAALALRSASVSVQKAPQGESEGLQTFVLTVHGPEAEISLEARRAGVLVAERALRLPVALGEVAMTSLGPRSLEMTFPPGRSAVTVDAFVDGRWAMTGVRTEPSFQLEDGERLVRVQARADRFTSDGAGARLLAGNALDARALIELAREARDEDGVSQSWAQDLPDFARADPETAAAFLLAPAEALRAQVPAPVSGRPAQLARLERTKVRMRYGVAGALALSAWLIALSVTRRGLLAVEQAQAILVQARGRAGEQAGEARGDDDEGDAAPRERINARAKVLLMGLAVAAAFLAGALLIAAKSLWF